MRNEEMMHIACWYSNTIKHMNIQYCKDMRIIAKKLYYPRVRNGTHYTKKILSVLYLYSKNIICSFI